MIQNKFILDAYKRMRQLFGDEKEAETTESALRKSEDKVTVLRRYSEIVADQIDTNIKLIECFNQFLETTKEKDPIVLLKLRREYLQLKRETIDLEIEYYSKMDFIGHYEGRIKFSEEYNKEYSKQVNANLEKEVKKLEAALPHIPETTKQKTLALGILHAYYTNTKTQEERITIYKKIIDLYNNIKIFIPT